MSFSASSSPMNPSLFSVIGSCWCESGSAGREADGAREGGGSGEDKERSGWPDCSEAMDSLSLSSSAEMPASSWQMELSLLEI